MDESLPTEKERENNYSQLLSRGHATKRTRESKSDVPTEKQTITKVKTKCQAKILNPKTGSFKGEEKYRFSQSPII